MSSQVTAKMKMKFFLPKYFVESLELGENNDIQEELALDNNNTEKIQPSDIRLGTPSLRISFDEDNNIESIKDCEDIPHSVLSKSATIDVVQPKKRICYPINEEAFESDNVFGDVMPQHETCRLMMYILICNVKMMTIP